MERGDFYVLCPDNDVTPEMDRRRIEWAAGDLTENRPALSRWHPDHEAAFARHSGRPMDLGCQLAGRLDLVQPVLEPDLDDRRLVRDRDRLRRLRQSCAAGARQQDEATEHREVGPPPAVHWGDSLESEGRHRSLFALGPGGPGAAAPGGHANNIRLSGSHKALGCVD